MIITYALMGQELFAWKVKFDTDNIPIADPLTSKVEGIWPYVTFNTFNEALYSVFVVFANEEWMNILIDHYKATSGIQTVPFFMSLLMLGQYVLLNLFLAILLENFDEDTMENKGKKKLLSKASMRNLPWYKRNWEKIKIWFLAEKMPKKSKNKRQKTN